MPALTSVLTVLTLVLTCLPLAALTFSEWTTSHSLTGDNATATADPDGDRIPNLIEFAIDGMSPTVLDAGHASLPQVAFFRRTGNALGDWEHTGQRPSVNGTGGVWHVGLTFRPRPGAVGIRYIPQISDRSTLLRWFGGRSVFEVQLQPGFAVQAVALTQAQQQKTHFVRLEIMQDATVTDPLEGLSVAGIASQALDLSSPASAARVIANGSSSTGTDDDLTTLITTGATSATDYLWNWEPASTNLQPVTLTRSSSDPAVIAPDPTNDRRWTYASTGTATLTMQTGSSTYTADVTTSTATGQTVTTVTGSVPGSLRAHIIAQIDDRLAASTPATGLALYSTRTPGTSTYVRNTSNWAASADLTAHAAYNSASNTAWTGATLISPCHIITADHTSPWLTIGATLHFVSLTNTVTSRTITAAQTITGTDIRICKLNADVGTDINFARILPATWGNKLPTLGAATLPIARITQNQTLIVEELVSLDTNARFTRAPSSRADWYQPAVVGDSGTPSFFLVNGQMILITTRYTSESGPSASSYAAEINAAMTTLGGGYQLTEASLSSFTTF